MRLLLVLAMGADLLLLVQVASSGRIEPEELSVSSELLSHDEGCVAVLHRLHREDVQVSI